MAPGDWHEVRDGMLILHLRVQPRARHDEILDIHGGRLRIRLNAPPVDDKANTALVAMLAESFGVPRQSVQLTQGEKSRSKTVRLPCPASFPDWFQRLSGAVAAPRASL
jgi:uncharacterized protein (TIGR00251 family)